MWQIANHTPYAAERTWIRDKHGAHHWIVAVKASFHVDPGGQLSLADEQLPPLFAPEYHGDDGRSSVRYDADLGPLKPATDVWVNGHACAPHLKPVAELPISLRFAAVEKTLLVRGDNLLTAGIAGPKTTRPRPFVRMPITYERAYGGTDLSAPDPTRHRIYFKNPVGVGFNTSRAGGDDLPGPNVVYPGQDIAAAGPPASARSPATGRRAPPWPAPTTPGGSSIVAPCSPTITTTASCSVRRSTSAPPVICSPAPASSSCT